MRRLKVSLGALALTATVATGCASEPTTVNAQQAPPASSGDGRLRVIATLPDGYDPPVNLVADPTRAGVWFWANSEAESTAFLWDSEAQRLDRWPIGDPVRDGLLFAADAGMAVGGDGKVWIGANSTLLSLVPSTGEISRWDVPASPASATVDANRPPSIRGTQTIRALDVDPVSGKVAIAASGTAKAKVFDSGSGHFEELSLPMEGEPNDVAFNDTGELAVVVNGYPPQPFSRLALFPRDRSTPPSMLDVEASHIARRGRGLVANYLDIALIENGAVTDVIPDAAVPHVRAVAGRDGRVVAGNRGGIGIVDPRSRQRSEAGFPTRPCPESHVPGSVEGTSGRSSGTCVLQPRAVAEDSVGRVYYLTYDGDLGALAGQ